MFDNIASTYATGGMKESTEIPARISHKTSSVRIPAATAPNALSHSWITGNAVIIFVDSCHGMAVCIHINVPLNHLFQLMRDSERI